MNQIMFWSNYSGEQVVEEWRNKEISLTALHSLTFRAHEKLGNPVKLFTYQKINYEFPENVEVIDAHEVYDVQQVLEYLKSGHSIVKIADLVRMREVSRNTGVIMDLDAIPLRKFPEEGFLCSMPAKMTGAFAPQWGDAHPPLTINDGSWDGKALSNLPISVDKEMGQYLYNISKIVEETLAKKPSKSSKAWNYPMWELKRIPQLNKKYHVYPPLFTSPVPAWLGKGKCYSLESPTRLDGKTELFGYTMPSIDTILNNSFCVLHFFESVFKGSDLTGKGFWDTVPEECLLAREAEYIVGKDWRKVLSEK
jgi:hypothetical protein